MGRPKLSLPFGDELMLPRIVRILRSVVSPVVVVAGPNQEVPSLPDDVRIVRDEQEHLGPLAGIEIGLRSLREVVSAVYVSSCDVPLLQPEFIAEMIRRLGTHELAVPREGKFHHPLAAVYRTSLAERVRQLVTDQRLRPLFLIQASDAVEVLVEELMTVDPQLHSLRNLNRPEDYEEALRLADFVEQ
ncbi:MAG: molybdenum cofactor guanylyltransferase [Planctomycetaceae bacterium]|nr:molybdenum cofactor guanylyltransferase [Planctomycetaceae bacterium]